ncbi:MAG TPA: hypothetical protein PLS29_02695, partial [Acidimicrobiales bacterium]|nr:hypothetical protein [Acidimicrobiales bacterium]
FFSLMIVGLTNALPPAMLRGLTTHGVPVPQATVVAHLPAVGSLFSSFLGFNPLKTLLVSPSSAHVSAAQWTVLTGKRFFPGLIQDPFHHGLVIVFLTAFVLALVGAAFSALRGKRYVHGAEPTTETLVGELAGVVSGVPGEPALEDGVVR